MRRLGRWVAVLSAYLGLRPPVGPPESSIVTHSTASARRTVVAALAGGAVMLLAFLAERVLFQEANEAAVDRLLQAQRAADGVRLADERLTKSAFLAAASGEARWVAEYNQQLPVIDAAIAEAIRLAPAELALNFDAETRDANDQLVELEAAALAAVERGDRQAAQAILNGGVYQRHKGRLSAGTDRFIDGMVEELVARRRLVRQRGEAILVAVVLGTLVAALSLWRGLTRSLGRSEEAFLEAEQRIQNLAMNDVLTGLTNRNGLREALPAAMMRVGRTRGSLALLVLDLDRFKPINDAYGHVVGDLVLKEVAQRMIRTLRGGEIRARLGGDEFVVVLEYGGEEDVPRRVAQRICQALREPIRVDALVLSVGVSAGFAVFPRDASTAEELLRRADLALYAAKRAGRDLICAFEESLDTDSQHRARLESELHRALEAGEIVPYFQPLVNLSTGQVQGFEVLARWLHPTDGLLPPAQFIPVAEASGLIGAVTRSMLRAACRFGAQLPDELTLAINVSPFDIQDERLAERIREVLEDTGFPAYRLEIELTENALVQDIAAARRVIGALKALGIKVALDDFGTGYSSLYYLSELPFDKIKIDRSFVRTLHDRPESAKIVHAIVGLGRSLGLPTIGEGVETVRDAEVLREIGCNVAQGYLYARPMPAVEVVPFLGAERPGGVNTPATRVILATG